MPRLSKFVFSYGATALAAGLLLVAAPRAAHAVVATLVQVSNTVTNPAITQSTNLQAAQLVELITHPIIPPASDAQNQLTTETHNGEEMGAFSVPAGQNLVITSADVTATDDEGGTCVSDNSVTLNDGHGTGNIRANWIVAAHQGTSHFTYPSGIVFLSGGVPFIFANTGCYTFVSLQGYYTAN